MGKRVEPHDFVERLQFTEGIKHDKALFDHLVAAVPSGRAIRKATEAADKHGTDYWIDRNGLPPISVDFKNRGICPIKEFGSDDACIETTSVYRGPIKEPWLDEYREQVGWTLNMKKRTDLLVYTWPKETQRRFWILYFPFLCEASRRHWKKWAEEYRERPAPNPSYVTLSIFVPRIVIASAIRELTNGAVD